MSRNDKRDYCIIYLHPTDSHKEKLGTKVGQLTLIRAIGRDQNRNLIWRTKCDCGLVVSRRESTFHNTETPACEICFNKNKIGRNAGRKHSRWKGYKGVCGSSFYRAKAGAESRNLEFNITIEQMGDLLEQQDYLCALSGIMIAADDRIRDASLDRIDSSRGYTIDNIQWVHKDVNRMKLDYPQERFLELCSLIANWSKKNAVSSNDC